MVQLHDMMVKKTTRHGPRAILALDLKCAFDNVTSASRLSNLKMTMCDRRTFGYVEDFLTNRTATITVEGENTVPIELGERGTLQGSVRSPLLFNLAVLPLHHLLEQIDGIDHSLYADDITVWTKKGGSDGRIEDSL
ncbi:uncharacterized protein LOC144148246 [Haemaphysalis longicornis]